MGRGSGGRGDKQGVREAGGDKEGVRLSPAGGALCQGGGCKREGGSLSRPGDARQRKDGADSEGAGQGRAGPSCPGDCQYALEYPRQYGPGFHRGPLWVAWPRPATQRDKQTRCPAAARGPVCAARKYRYGSDKRPGQSRPAHCARCAR